MTDYLVGKNDRHEMFDASAALAANSAGKRVESHADQHRLDIEDKTRTSVLPWRGQFSPQLTDFLIEMNAPKAGFVVDPFCGSGTVLYEAAEHGMGAYAVDINPAAICLAQFSEICRIPKKDRYTIIDEMRSFMTSLCGCVSDDPTGTITTDQATLHLDARNPSAPVLSALRASLLIAFGRQHTTTAAKVSRASRTIQRAIMTAPHTIHDIMAEIGDARELPIKEACVDYIVTSPPYINVFNYHQNYRPITESLGYEPLPIARAEIGANRKFRQNRYMTVVQYCIDMALFIAEAQRILKPQGCMTIVLGRMSNVRGVALRNGEIIGAVAAEGMGWSVQNWHERKFMNRFGETIFEDVITLAPPPAPSDDVEKIGRLVGTEALRTALKNAPPDRAQEIGEAIDAAPDIMPSPFVLR